MYIYIYLLRIYYTTTQLMRVQTSVGPDNVAGYDAVQRLAHYLVSLVDAIYLTAEQVDTITGMRQALAPCDQQRVRYRPRHKKSLASGRFGRSKSSTATPGVESVKR